MSSHDRDTPLLECRDLTVEYGGKIGIKNISLKIQRGEIHAIVGNHGSGKSTLLDTLSGVVQKTSGTLLFEGKPIERHTSRDALEMGIQTLPQSLSLVKSMNAYENIFLNRELRRFMFFNDVKRMREKTLESFRIIGLEADPDIPVRFHNSIDQQQIETAKVLCFPSTLLLVDQVSDRLPPEDLERLHYVLSRLRQNGTTIIYTTDNIDEIIKFASRVSVLKEGEIIDTAELSKINSDKLVSLTFASIFDRNSLEKSNLELFYLNNLIRNVIDSLPIGILVTNSTMKTLLLNKWMETAFSIHLKEVYEKDVEDIGLFSAEDSALIKRKIESNEVIEKLVLSPSGKAEGFETTLSAFPFYDENRSPLGTIFLFTHGGESVYREEIKSFVSDLDKQNAIMGIAHEINNPLGIILNYIQLMKNSGAMDNLIKSNVEIIDNEIKRIKRILRGLTETDSTPADENTFVSVQSVTREVISLLEPKFESGGIAVQVDLDEDFRLKIDLDMFKQVLLNLTLNSIEAMESAGSIFIKQISLEKEGTEYRGIEVRDTGQGIQKSNMNRIFDPFFTTKTDSDSRGIGLSLCRDIMNKVEGFIDVISEEGEGTCFQIYFPEGRYL